MNTGFGEGDDWDARCDGMREGWRLFLRDLQLHLRHFRGQHDTSMLPMAMWTGEREAVWARLLAALGLPYSPAVGDRVHSTGDAPVLGGTVLDVESWRLALLLDAPAPGTAFVAAEGDGGACRRVGVSAWSRINGDDREVIIERARGRWNASLTEHAAG